MANQPTEQPAPNDKAEKSVDDADVPGGEPDENTPDEETPAEPSPGDVPPDEVAPQGDALNSSL